MKKLIFLITTLLLVAVMNATNIKNLDVTTPSGTLNVSVEQYTNGIYDLLVSEPTKHASNVFMTDFPFKENRKAFDEACKEAYIALFKSVYPELCSQITGIMPIWGFCNFCRLKLNTAFCFSGSLFITLT